MPLFNAEALIAALSGVPFDAQWKGPIEGWTVNYINKNHWRVARTMPREDCFQEAYCAFLRCKRKYKVHDPAHFMALYQTTLTRDFADFANADTADRVTCELPTNEDGDLLDRVGEIDGDGYLATLIRQAPQEVLMVLNLMLRAPQELIAEVLASWSGNIDPRRPAHSSARVNELLGLPIDQDTLGAVRNYFS